MYLQRRGRYAATHVEGGRISARYARQRLGAFETRHPSTSGGTPSEVAGDDWLNLAGLTAPSSIVDLWQNLCEVTEERKHEQGFEGKK